MRHALKIARLAGPLLVAGACLTSSIGGCGRIGIDRLEATGTPDGDPGSNTADAGVDTAPAICPPGTTELGPGAATCIEKEERGTSSWTNATASCASVGRRLCSDAEWALACVEATGLVDMFDDQGSGSGSGSGSAGAANWEWTGDMDAGAAKKRGLLSCDDASAHDIDVDGYDFRCCVPKS